MLRVNVNDDELEDIPGALGGFRTVEGANLLLVADPDRLAFVDRDASTDGHFTAPPSRVLLDLYLEPRGAAAAERLPLAVGGPGAELVSALRQDHDKMMVEVASLFQLLGGMAPRHLTLIGGLVPPLLVPSRCPITAAAATSTSFCR